MLADLRKARIVAAVCMLFCANAHSQTTLLNEVHTVADSAHAVPVEHNVDISLPGTYQVTLVDLGAALTPSAPLTSVALAITNGSSIVGTPLTAAGSAQFSATVGQYTIHVVGVPGQVPGSGPIGIQITSVPGNTVIASFSDTLALPATALPSNERALDDTFTVSSSGSYTVTLSDLQLPQSLTTLALIITTASGTIVTNPPLGAAGPPVTVSLQSGVSYRVFAVGQADPTVNAGLYGVVVGPAGGTQGSCMLGNAAPDPQNPTCSWAVPVGAVAAGQSASLTAGTSYTLALVDLAAPSALQKLGAVLTVNGQAAAQLGAAGNSAAFTATSGSYQVFALASTTTTGSYAVTVAPQGGGPAALSFARAVSAPGSAVSAYSYDATIGTAGSYNLDLADFGIPTALAPLSAFAVQGGTVLGTPLKAAGTGSVTAAAGPVSLLVFAQPTASGGLLEIDLTPTAGGNPAFETTQGVGQLFSARQVPITAAGSYAVNVSDLGFPAQLGTFAVIVTSGGTHVGSIYGGGAFSFAATPQNYFVNFIAQPSGTAGAGTYALTVAPAPVVTLQSSASAVTSGGTVNLTWTSQNATACVASGGWNGTQALSGSATSAPLTAAATFTLTCSGNGVSVAQSVTVSVNTPPKSGGGGGALDLMVLLALTGVLLLTPSGVRQGWRI